MYVKKTLSYVFLEINNCKNVYAIRLINFNLFLVIVCRPLSYNHSENSNLLESLTNFCTNKEVLGDFNLPLIQCPLQMHMIICYPPLQQSFIDCFISLGLHQWVHSPTFIQFGSILDLVLSSECDRIGDVQIQANFPSCGHSPLVFQHFFQIGVEVSTYR